MAREKKIFVCSNCGQKSTKWLGKCISCNEWNTYLEEIQITGRSSQDTKFQWNNQSNKSHPVLISEISSENNPRLLSHDPEFDRVLGGGMVPGSLILLAGQPGIGKSTLLLQIAHMITGRVLYVSGEESKEQIKMRADRIGIKNPELYIFTETTTTEILNAAKNLLPSLLIIDSIQTISSPHIDSIQGSITQIRETTLEIQKLAKESGIPIIIIGHITKEGSIAGPKILEHIVDVVLQFEGDRHHLYRLIRTQKNRFGSTDELAIYEMEEQGLCGVSNPSKFLISPSTDHYSGSSVAATIEGLRPLLAETQALVGEAIYGTPQRSSTGYDVRRLHMILAVIEKRANLFFGQKDVFLNIAGGIRIVDPSIDLSVVVSLISSLLDIPVDKKFCFTGEVGLNGEIRTVNRVEQRITEAARLGFTHIFIPHGWTKKYGDIIHTVEIKNINELRELIFS